MEGHAVPRPQKPMVEQGLDVGDQGKDREDEESKNIAFEVGPAQRLSCIDAICSEISPNRNTTTPSWISRAEPMGILSNFKTFQIP